MRRPRRTTDKRKATETKLRTRTIALSYSERKHDEGDEPIFDVAISSETDDVQRFFGREILLHGPRNVDLDRLKNVAGVLLNHDPDQIVGAIVDPRVDKDRVLRIGVRFDPTQAGQDAKAQMLNGSLRGASLQYSYGPADFREIAEGQSVKVNGREITGPARIVKRWQVIEPTLTPVPADPSVGSGRIERNQPMHKWKAELADGSQVQRFATKADATKWVDERDDADEWTVSRIEAKRAAPVTPPADDPKPGDEAAIEKRIRTKIVEDSAEIRQVASLAGCPERAEELIAQPGGFDLDVERRSMIADAEAARLKDNAPPKRAAPKAPVRADSFAGLDDKTIVANLQRRNFASFEGESLGPNILRSDDWRSLIKNSGTGLQERVNSMFKSGTLKPRDVSFLSLYNAFGDGLPVQAIVRDDITGDYRAVQSSAFQVLAGSTVIAAVRAGYEGVENIGDQLTNPYDSSAAVDTIPAILTDQAMREVGEGGQYEEGSASEEFHTIGSKKQGRILAMTREMIQRDQSGTFINAANRLGEKAQSAIEKLVLRRISDADTKVYAPAGVATALYSAVAKARGTNLVASNALVNETDLDAARNLLATMTDNEGDPINARPEILLVPDALLKVALKISGSEMKPGIENELNNWGPRGRWTPRVLSSPFLDAISATTWYLGDPSQQFWKKTAFGIETTMQGRESDAWMTHDVAMKFRVAFDVEVGAIDYVHFIQNTA